MNLEVALEVVLQFASQRVTSELQVPLQYDNSPHRELRLLVANKLEGALSQGAESTVAPP